MTIVKEKSFIISTLAYFSKEAERLFCRIRSRLLEGDL